MRQAWSLSGPGLPFHGDHVLPLLIVWYGVVGWLCSYIRNPFCRSSSLFANGMVARLATVTKWLHLLPRTVGIWLFFTSRHCGTIAEEWTCFVNSIFVPLCVCMYGCEWFPFKSSRNRNQTTRQQLEAWQNGDYKCDCIRMHLRTVPVCHPIITGSICLLW